MVSNIGVIIVSHAYQDQYTLFYSRYLDSSYFDPRLKYSLNKDSHCFKFLLKFYKNISIQTKYYYKILEIHQKSLIHPYTNLNIKQNYDYQLINNSMQIQDSNFFTTEIPNSQRYTIDNNHINLSNELSGQKRNPSIRIRQAKSQAKKIANIYRQTLRDYLKTKNSVERNTSQTHKLRGQFIKLYSNKKSKFLNKSLLDNKKQEDEQYQLQANNRVRAIKMSNDLGLQYSRNEWDQLSNRVRQQNRRLADKLQKQLKIKRKEELDQAKYKFQMIKKGQTEFLIRKKNMSAMVSTRAHHNYLSKISQQMQLLQNYTKLMEKVNDFKDLHVLNKQDGQIFSKTFFVTTKNSLG